jgi:hypothetical protein
VRRIVLFVIATALVVAVIVPAAPAHRTHHKWYWSAADAENELLKTRLRWKTDEGQVVDVVTRAKCYGFGRWYGGDRRDKKLFQHFRCLVGTWKRESYWIVFHTAGETKWFYTWDRWAR